MLSNVSKCCLYTLNLGIQCNIILAVNKVLDLIVLTKLSNYYTVLLALLIYNVGCYWLSNKNGSVKNNPNILFSCFCL